MAVITKQKMPEESGPGDRQSQNAKVINLPIKITTSSDKCQNDAGSSRFEHGQRQTGRQNPSTTKPTASFSKKEKGGKRTTDSTKMETKVNTWERAKMDKIRQRYEKMKSIILEWQNGKRLKAKCRLERKEKDLELRRARASREHQIEVSRIDKMADGARALAEERKRNGESTTMEKAIKMRSTGKVPHTCFCF
ncbi:hypothetical protein BHM03_00000911 [Ensete ventricosum]|nr:hypothetical protein BHM03_00000911 [Ensete ventricosum]